MKLRIIDGIPIWPQSLDKELAQIRAGVWRISELEKFYGLEGTIGRGRTHKIYLTEEVDKAIKRAHGLLPAKEHEITGVSEQYYVDSVKFKKPIDHLDN